MREHQCALPGHLQSSSLGLQKGSVCWAPKCIDFVMILTELGSHGSNLTEEELESHTIPARRDGKSFLTRPLDGAGKIYSKATHIENQCLNCA
ncbi:hypothetical protein QQ045_031770 [Rhodiola kirilowii]